MNNTLILRRRGFQAFQGWLFWIQIVLGLSMFVSVGVLLYIFPDKELFSKSFVYVPFAYIVFFFFQSKFMHRSKLEVDDFGFSHVSGLPDLFKRFLPDWRVSWAEIQSVEKTKNNLLKHTVLLPLNLKLFDRSIKVIPNQWVDPKEESKKPWYSLHMNLAIKFEDNVLVKILESKGFLDLKRSKVLGKSQAAWVAKSLGTDINSHPVSISMAGFLFFALFYFIIEVYFTLSEYYAGSPPYIYMIVGGLIAVIVSYFLLVKTEFKVTEKIILAVFMGGSMAAVMYPLMLRVNEWTDKEGLHSHSYVKSGLVNWTSDRNNFQIPTLKFDLASSEYWGQFEIGDIKNFELRKGGLGFYQLNMEPVYEEQREFYKDK